MAVGAPRGRVRDWGPPGRPGGRTYGVTYAECQRQGRARLPLGRARGPVDPDTGADARAGRLRRLLARRGPALVPDVPRRRPRRPRARAVTAVHGRAARLPRPDGGDVRHGGD